MNAANNDEFMVNHPTKERIHGVYNKTSFWSQFWSYDSIFFIYFN